MSRKEKSKAMGSNPNQKSKTENEKNKSGLGTGLEALAIIPQLSLTFAVPIVLGAAAGHWLDGKLGTGMIFFVILLCLGIAGGITGAWRLISRLISK